MTSRPVKRVIRSLFNFVIAGRFFRLYAPKSPPAPPGARRTLAICDLIPHLGDKVMIFPLIDALRQENPGLEITYFTSGADSLMKSHPGIDHLYTVKRLSNSGKSLSRPALFLTVLRWWYRDLRHLRFHTVVVLRGGIEPSFSHYLAWLLGGDKRVGYSTKLEPERSEFASEVSSLLTDEIKEMRGVHEVERGAEVLQLAGLLHRPIDLKQPVESLLAIARITSLQSYIEELGLSNRPYAVIAPGAAAIRRMWPASSFSEAYRRELIPRGWLPVIVGGPEIADAAKVICDSLAGEVLDLTGKTNFEQLVAVCAGAQCFLGNDSGTSHVAGACGVPTVIVTAFAHRSLATHHASPKRSHPLGPWVAVLQPEQQMLPCTTECVADQVHCIEQVTVDEFVDTLRNLLEMSGRDKPVPQVSKHVQ